VTRRHPGDRVTVINGPFRGAGGRVTGVHDAFRYTVLFEDWHKVGDSIHLMAPVFVEDLGSYVVPVKHRPVAVGRLR
jgi:ribosomal protein L24